MVFDKDSAESNMRTPWNSMQQQLQCRVQGVARERRRGEDAAGRAAETTLGSNAGGEKVPWHSMAQPKKEGNRWK